MIMVCDCRKEKGKKRRHRGAVHGGFENRENDLVGRVFVS
jgi:hypothetical protein